MNREAELFCRDQLRHARSLVLKDSEAFTEVIFAIERTGAIALGKTADLARYKMALSEIANRSPLARVVPRVVPGLHTDFGKLYDLVRLARNEAMHLGSSARHLATHAVELCLVLEDGLVKSSDRIADYMVKGPLCAEPWQPLSVVRQQMLTNAFSYLPIRGDSEDANRWELISDLAIARYLKAAVHDGDRHLRLAHSVETARAKGLALGSARTVGLQTKVSDVLDIIEAGPILVVAASGELLGIVTPFDLL